MQQQQMPSTGLVPRERVLRTLHAWCLVGRATSVTTNICDTGGPSLEDPAMVLTPLVDSPPIVREDVSKLLS